MPKERYDEKRPTDQQRWALQNGLPWDHSFSLSKEELLTTRIGKGSAEILVCEAGHAVRVRSIRTRKEFTRNKPTLFEITFGKAELIERPVTRGGKPPNCVCKFRGKTQKRHIEYAGYWGKGNRGAEPR